jgi:SAM-dependent methyltransferase
MADLGTFYGEGYYQRQMDSSYRSGRIYASAMSEIMMPKNVVDIGCGRGTWLKAFKELGATTLVGFDGTWNSQDKMVDESITFYSCDLNRPIPSSTKFDLAMSVEVAEHLEPASSNIFIESLTNFSDVVLFGAAFTGQGGTNHINEQAHTYWAKIFQSFGFRPFDVFRPKLWGDERVSFWYRQNIFLYVKTDSESYVYLNSKGYNPLSDIAFMDCVHPETYLARILQPSFRLSLKNTLRAFYPAIKRRIGFLP